MFAYCNNNAVLYNDKTGERINGPSFELVNDGGGSSGKTQDRETKIQRTSTYGCEDWIASAANWSTYDTQFTKKGEMFENWYDEDGNKIWSRHHSDHGNPKWHKNPHDHEWKVKEDGNREPGDPLPPNPNFKSPTETNVNRENGLSSVEKAGIAVGGIAIGYFIYEGVKWTIAAIATPATGGASLVVALATP